MVVQVIFAFCATLGFSIILNVSKKYLFPASSVGALGWFIYMLEMNAEMDKRIAVFWAAFAVAILAHSYARCIKAPVTVFLIPGIFALVPGEGMYNIVYQMMQDSDLASFYFSHTIQTAGMIALGVFVADSLVRIPKGIKAQHNFDRD